jgi:hypothetical protein
MKQFLRYTLLFGLIFLLLFTWGKPVCFINDEWITASQLSQLANHHQVLYAEGKYGFLEDGSPTPYFKEKNLLLQYTMYLPLLSYIPLVIMKTAGDAIPYGASVAWSLCVIILCLGIRTNMLLGIHSRIIADLGITCSILFFFLNLWFYAPLLMNTESTNDELLGVWLFHMVLFILLLGVIYAICTTVFEDDTLYALFSIITCTCCSSYLFWTTTLKDHIDSVFFVALILYFLLQYQKTRDYWYFPVAFILSGLLTWIRPEYGFFVICMLVVVYGAVLRAQPLNLQKKYRFACIILCPFFTILGAIPLFVGNFLTTGHPFTLAWQVQPPQTYISQLPSSIPQETTFFSVILTVLNRITPHLNTLPADLYGVFLNPAALKAPILAITPVCTLGILLLPFLYLYQKKKIEKNEWITIFIFLSIVFATIAAYASKFNGLGTSTGIYPDVRYLCPVYLPLNIIGLILIRKILVNPADIKKIITWVFGIGCAGIPVILGLMTFFRPGLDFWGMFLRVNGFFTILVYCSIAGAFFMYAFRLYGLMKRDHLLVPISFLIALPFLWQFSLLVITNFYPVMFIAYPPLLPFIRALLEFLLTFGG